MIHQTSIPDPIRPQSASSKTQELKIPFVLDMHRAEMPAHFRRESIAGGYQAHEVNDGAQPKRSWWQALLPFGQAARDERVRRQLAAAHAQLQKCRKALEAHLDKCVENLKLLEKQRVAMLKQIAELNEQADPSQKAITKMVALAEKYHQLEGHQGETCKSIEKIVQCLVRSSSTSGDGDWRNRFGAELVERRPSGRTPVTPEEIKDLIALALSVREDSRQRSEAVR